MIHFLIQEKICPLNASFCYCNKFIIFLVICKFRHYLERLYFVELHQTDYNYPIFVIKYQILVCREWLGVSTERVFESLEIMLFAAHIVLSSAKWHRASKVNTLRLYSLVDLLFKHCTRKNESIFHSPKWHKLSMSFETKIVLMRRFLILMLISFCRWLC